MTLRAAFLTALPTPARPLGPTRAANARPLKQWQTWLRLLLAAVFLLGWPLPSGEVASRRYSLEMPFRFSDFEVDEQAFVLRRAGEPVSIAPLPLKLLLHLLERHPAVPTKDELMETLWPGTIVSEASLSQAVRAVRVALEEGAGEGVIRTVRGRGFGIGVPVRSTGPPARAAGAGGTATGAAGQSSHATEASAGVPRSPLLGRGHEMARARLALEGALAGHPRFLVILGEPGIGKTRLAEELTSEARDAGALLLFGRSLEGDQEPAFWPFVQILRSYAAVAEPGEFAAMLGAGARDIAAVVPEVGEYLPAGTYAPEARQEIELEQQRFRFFDAVTNCFAALAREHPLVIVLDDLHWADDASLRLLEFLAQEVPAAKLLVLATCRDAALAGDPGLQRTLAAISRGTHESDSLTLRGLDRAAIGELVESLSDPAPHADSSPGPRDPETLLEAVYSRSGGNPLFARELARWLGGDQATTGEIPVGVQQVIRHRLQQLPDETRRLLSAASIIGRDFGVALLAHASALDAGDVLAAVEPAEHAGIVEPVSDSSGVLRFAHALVRETLEADLSSAERARLHLRVGQALETLHAAQPERVLSELAAHFAAALPVGDPVPAFDYALKAAETDLRLLAFEQATRNAKLALRIADESGALPADARTRVLRTLADAQFHGGEREAAAKTWWSLVDSARRTEDAPALADAAMSLTWANVFTAHSHQETVALLREALDLLGTADSPRRARLLSWLARQVTWTEESDRQDELTRAAVEMARRLDETDTLLDVLGARGSILEHGGDDEDRRATYEELMKLAQAEGSRIFEADALTLRLQHRIELADSLGIDRDIVVLERLADALHHPFYQAFAARAAAMRGLWRGDVAEAEKLVERAFALGKQVDGEHAGVVLAAQLTALRRMQGRIVELEPGAREAADRYPMMASFRCALSVIHAEAGNQSDARATFERLAEGDFAEIRPDRPNYALNLALLSDACTALGDSDRALALEAKLEPLAGRHLTAPNAVSAGCASRYLGALAATRGEAALAEERFAEALDTESRLGANTWLVATLIDRARSRSAEGRREDALGDLERAIALAEPRQLSGPLAVAEGLRAQISAPKRARRSSGKRA